MNDLFINLHMTILLLNTAAAAKYIIPTAALSNTVKGTED
jgi:hypothetical protein